MTRIIAGEAGGLRLVVPRGKATRPTSDMAREGLLSAVTAKFGTLAGAAVLDLYAGSGAVGLEALSRGASDVVLVESDPAAITAIKRNISFLGLPGVQLVFDRVERFLRRGPGELARRDLVFADPPYAADADEVTWMLTSLVAEGWLAPDALVVVERDTRSGQLDWPVGYSQDRSRRYGETTLWYGRACGDMPDA